MKSYLINSERYLGKNLECIFCPRVFDLNEKFISYCNDKHIIIICMCLLCAESHKNDKEEKNGYWIAVQRTLNGYEILPLLKTQ